MANDEVPVSKSEGTTPCPAWCSDHEDVPAEGRRAAYGQHSRPIDAWPSRTSGRTQLVRLWRCTYPDGQPDDGPMISIPGGDCVSPKDANRTAEAIGIALRLLDVEANPGWRGKLRRWFTDKWRWEMESWTCEPDENGSYTELIDSWRRRGLIGPQRQPGRWAGKTTPRTAR
jgi:hypothetical protein